MSQALPATVAGAVGLVLLAISGVAAMPEPASPPGGRHEIQMKAVSFAPKTLTVEVGDTIVWRNVDIVRHNATRSDLFESGDLRTGERFEWVPRDTGVVSYRCTIHRQMRGEIRVLK